MRFCVPIVLKNKSDPAKAVVLDSNYNGYFLSLIKLGLSSTNPALYAHLYEQKNVKDFATSVYFPSAFFDHNKIHLNRDGKVLLNFTEIVRQKAPDFNRGDEWLIQNYVV